MSNENQNKITFARLKRYLKRIGFDQSVTMEQTVAFHHEGSGVIVTLTVPEDGVSIRSADLLSILVRLEIHGIESKDGIRQLQQGQIPVAA